MEGYPAYVLSGFIAWTFFAQTSSNSINTLVWGGDLFSRIYIPRSAFAISTIGTGLVNLLLSMVPLLAVMVAIKVPLSPTILLSPLAMLPLAMFSLGVGLMISTAGIFFADVVEMYTIILTAWMYLTPIIYPLEALPDYVSGWIQLNPMVHLVELFRSLVFYGRVPLFQDWLITFGFALATLVAGWLVFTRKSGEFAYRT
jgi:ABC-type polysaccharide/polyol phosphate export permease